MKQRILIVDDEEDFRAVLGDMVRHWGHEPVFAGNGLDAMRKVRESPPDLVLLDIDMPLGGGLPFLSRFKNLYPAVPVVMVSGVGDAAGRDAMLFGASDFVTKPVAPEYLKTAIWANLAAA